MSTKTAIDVTPQERKGAVFGSIAGLAGGTYAGGMLADSISAKHLSKLKGGKKGVAKTIAGVGGSMFGGLVGARVGGTLGMAAGRAQLNRDKRRLEKKMKKEKGKYAGLRKACGKCGRKDYADIRAGCCDRCAFPDKKKKASADEYSDEAYYKHWAKEGPKSLPKHHSKLTGKDKARFKAYLASERSAPWAPKKKEAGLMGARKAALPLLGMTALGVGAAGLKRKAEKRKRMELKKETRHMYAPLHGLTKEDAERMRKQYFGSLKKTGKEKEASKADMFKRYARRMMGREAIKGKKIKDLEKARSAHKKKMHDNLKEWKKAKVDQGAAKGNAKYDHFKKKVQAGKRVGRSHDRLKRVEARINKAKKETFDARTDTAIVGGSALGTGIAVDYMRKGAAARAIKNMAKALREGKSVSGTPYMQMRAAARASGKDAISVARQGGSSHDVMGTIERGKALAAGANRNLAQATKKAPGPATTRQRRIAHLAGKISDKYRPKRPLPDKIRSRYV